MRVLARVEVCVLCGRKKAPSCTPWRLCVPASPLLCALACTRVWARSFFFFFARAHPCLFVGEVTVQGGRLCVSLHSNGKCCTPLPPPSQQRACARATHVRGQQEAAQRKLLGPPKGHGTCALLSLLPRALACAFDGSGHSRTCTWPHTHTTKGARTHTKHTHTVWARGVDADDEQPAEYWCVL